MKKILRHFFIETFILFVVSRIAEGLVFSQGLKTLALAGAAIAAASFLVKPVINIFLLPINLVTFNLFKWLSAAITLYLVTLVVPGFGVTGFVFTGYSSELISLPPISLGGPLAYIAFSFLLSVITAFIYWIVS